ncbi:2-Hydroxyacid oxidase 2-like isoform X1 [Ptychodera flava]|uniref:2-Hydroxyacid oxidase 2-like isoform X1 n=1 Tax=Ptychodera flava TaxID=63121 RepID=UPI00396A630B
MADSRRLVCLDDFEARAKEILPLPVWAYYSSGADEEITLRENRKAYRRYWLKPRVLRDVSAIDIATTVLGERITMPICISPTAFHGMAHPEAEIATCKAVAEMNTIMIMSNMSNNSLEDLQAERPLSNKWQSVSLWPNRKSVEDFVGRTERAGFKAIVVTVDGTAVGVKRRLVRLGGYAILPISRVGNLEKFVHKDKKLRSLEGIPNDVKYTDPSVDWKDIAWLRSITKLPIILKGITSVEDAVLAAKRRIDGIIVSNHGGRNLDGTPASIDLLSDIVDAVGDKLEVYVDGGIRTGTDVLKALALGARAVFIGRPVLYGLACNGEEGVKEVLKILRDELSRAMALTGCCRLVDISRDLIRGSSRLSKL